MSAGNNPDCDTLRAACYNFELTCPGILKSAALAECGEVSLRRRYFLMRILIAPAKLPTLRANFEGWMSNPSWPSLVPWH